MLPDPISVVAYDVIGNISAMTRQLDGSSSTSYDYFYDNADQLRDAMAMVGTTTTKAWHYNYDDGGNRLSDETQTTPRTFSYGTHVNNLTSQAARGPVRVSGAVSPGSTVTVNGQSATSGAKTSFSTDLASQAPGAINISVAATASGGSSATANFTATVGDAGARTFQFDSNGSCTSDGLRSYTWDRANRLATITQGTSVTTFVYDGLGRRVQEKFNGNVIKQWIWANSELAEERDGSNNTIKRFFPQGQEINGTAYYYTRDHLGSVREMTDAGGNLRARYDYDPYGQLTKVSGDLEADFGFAGYYRHQTSGLYLTLYRAYDANVGRWLSRDPIGEDGGINLYGYVGNNPINGVDPFGLASDYPGGHHAVPRQIWGDWPSSYPARDVFRSYTLPVNDQHAWDSLHKAYNDSLSGMWEAFKKQRGITDRSCSANQAREFVGQVASSRNKAVGGYLKRVVANPGALKALGALGAALTIASAASAADVHGQELVDAARAYERAVLGGDSAGRDAAAIQAATAAAQIGGGYNYVTQYLVLNALMGK